jgi:hypothetical protein
MIEDPRKTVLKNGLRQLTVRQLKRVYDYPNEMVLDSFNYEDGKFCPLAIALELDKTVIEPTHDKIFNELTSLGYKVYNTRGIDGKFYTINRKEDLKEAVWEVFHEKLFEAAANGLCPCKALRDRCGQCDNGYHIFCNHYPHGDMEEAYQWFINNPEATKQIKPRTPSPEYNRALQEINKKENAE